MKRLLTIILSILLLVSANALAESVEPDYPISAWTTRQVDTFSRPEEGAQDGGLIAPTGWVVWLDTQGEWAHVEAQGGYECYVPVDALTTGRVFYFDSHPTRSGDWLYEGQLHVSPDGTVRIAISMAEEYEGMSVFDGGELLRFEVVDECSGEIVCTAEMDPDSDPIVFTGEGVCTEGTSLLVRPVLWHSGYSVEIQW